MTVAGDPGARRFERRIASTWEAVEGACHELRDFLAATGPGQARFGTELVVREFLNNAVLHGNRLDPTRTALLEVGIGRTWITVRVTDEGAGFDWRRVLQRPAESATATRGRGLTIGKTYGSSVTYGLGGRRVTVRLAKHPGGRS